jgi:hypothetical protein
MTRAELVKAMSKAEMPDLSQAGWNKVYAANMLAAIEAAGCVVVPREPTEAMVEAGRLPYRGDISTRVYGAPDARIVGYTFAAMLAASPLAKERGA